MLIMIVPIDNLRAGLTDMLIMIIPIDNTAEHIFKTLTVVLRSLLNLCTHKKETTFESRTNTLFLNDPFNPVSKGHHFSLCV